MEEGEQVSSKLRLAIPFPSRLADWTFLISGGMLPVSFVFPSRFLSLSLSIGQFGTRDSENETRVNNDMHGYASRVNLEINL